MSLCLRPCRALLDRVKPGLALALQEVLPVTGSQVNVQGSAVLIGIGTDQSADKYRVTTAVKPVRPRSQLAGTIAEPG